MVAVVVASLRVSAAVEVGDDGEVGRRWMG